MYAIIESCGKQYKVEKGEVVFFEKLNAEEGKKVTFENVVLLSDDGKVKVGNPYVKGVKVEGKVVAHGKGKKIIVFKMKPKKNYRRTQGHRQPYTKVEITAISTGTTAKAETKTESATDKKPATKSTTTKAAAAKTTAKKTTTKAATAKSTTKKTTSTAKKSTTATKKTTTKKLQLLKKQQQKKLSKNS